MFESSLHSTFKELSTSSSLDGKNIDRNPKSSNSRNTTKPFAKPNIIDVSCFPSVFEHEYFDEFMNEYSQIDSLLVLRAADGILEFGNIIQRISQDKQQIQADSIKFKEKLLSVSASPKKQIAEVAIYIYTHNSFIYKEMNKALREQDKSKACIGYYAYLLTLSLNQLSNETEYKPYDGPLFRGVLLTEEQKQEYIKAFEGKHSKTIRRNGLNYFTWTGFTSTTKNLSKAIKFGNTLFVISFDKTNPIEVENISFFPKGVEVLFNNRVNCAVKDIKTMGQFMVIQIVLTSNLGI